MEFIEEAMSLGIDDLIFTPFDEMEFIASVIEIKVKSNDESVSYIINIEKVQKQKQSITLTCVFIAVILVIIGATIFLLVKIIKNKKVIDKQKSNIEFI